MPNLGDRAEIFRSPYFFGHQVLAMALLVAKIRQTVSPQTAKTAIILGWPMRVFWRKMTELLNGVWVVSGVFSIPLEVRTPQAGEAARSSSPRLVALRESGAVC